MNTRSSDVASSAPPGVREPESALASVARGRRIVSLTMIGLGLPYTVASLRLDRGDLAHPGPGLFPVLVGVLAVLAGLGGVVELRRGQVSATGETLSSGKKPWIFIAAMALAVVLFPTMGYFFSALVGGAAVSWSAGQKTLWKALLIGLAIAVVSSILFRELLDVYLPSSILDELF